MDDLVGNPDRDPTRYCFVSDNEIYLVYLGEGGTTTLDLSGATGEFDVKWFNPRTGGQLQSGDVQSVEAAGKVELGNAPADPDEDWLVVLRKKK